VPQATTWNSKQKDKNTRKLENKINIIKQKSPQKGYFCFCKKIENTMSHIKGCEQRSFSLWLQKRHLC
jgi:hypothetical protein